MLGPFGLNTIWGPQLSMYYRRFVLLGRGTPSKFRRQATYKERGQRYSPS